MNEELITALSKVVWLFVASRASCFADKGRAIGTRQIAQELGVRYLLQGSVRNGGEYARIAVQLVDGLLDQHIWAEQYDAEIGDTFAVQAEICDKVMTAIGPQLYISEWIRAERKSPEDLNAWECMVRALRLMSSREKINASKAQALLRKAISLENESAQAHSLLSIVTTFRLHMGWVNRHDTVPLATDLARKAISSNPYEPWAHAALGYALIWQHPEEAILPCLRSIALDPNLATSHYYLALAYAYAGYCDQVFPHADMAERLAQKDLLARAYPGAANNVRSTGSFARGHYREGVDFARRSILDTPSSPTAYRGLVINLALQGEVESAQRALRTLKHVLPEISQSWIRQNAVWASQETMKRYAEAFRAAGLK
jgi:tetratricopeptide (TPR) repeat protein